MILFYEVLLLGELVWNIPLFVFLLGIAILYFFLLRLFSDLKLYNKQPLLFYLSLCLLYLLIGTPFTTISHFSFTLHMLQMSILFFIVTPLILIGIPEPMLEKILQVRIVKKVSKLILTPKLALYIFSILFLLYHLPIVSSLFIHSYIQITFLLFLFMLSFSIWWPIVSPDSKQRINNEQRKRYVFLNGLVLMPACIVFILSALTVEIQNPFLHQISAQLCLPLDTNSINLLPFPFNTKYDQFLAAIIMLGLHKFSLHLFSRHGMTEKEKLLVEIEG